MGASSLTLNASRRKSADTEKTVKVQFLALLVIASLLLAPAGAVRIRPKPCNNAVGESGTCMFALECLNSDGKHLGTCRDDFFYGSCCAHPADATNAVQDNEGEKIKPNEVQIFQASTKTTTTTTTTTTETPTTSTGAPQLPVTNTLLVARPPRPPVPAQPPYTINRWTTLPPYTFRPFQLFRPHHSSIFSLAPRPTVPAVDISSTFVQTTPSTIPETSTISLPATAALLLEETRKKQKPEGRGCGLPTLHPQTKVVGGKNAAFGAWPWQVSVRRTSFFGFSSTHRCGGAVLNKNWIATAGHCVDDLLLSQIRIRVGEYDFSSLLEPYPYIEKNVVKKVVHPSYNFFTYENDLALVKVDEPLDFGAHVAPICLPPNTEDLVGRNATVTGWGRLSEGGILPSVLQQVQVPIVSNDKCKNMFLAAGRHEYIPEIFMCAGHEEGGHDSCQGDSGGPLQVQGEDGRWFLAGIISWGIGCAEPNLPGVCTRISKFKDWIVKNIT